MSPTPEKADDGICPSVSAFPGERAYACTYPSDQPHKLHDDGEHHRWFDAIPDLPISTWQADWLERIGALASDAERAADAAVRAAREAARGFVTTGHQNTDRALALQAEANARTFDELRLAELRRQQDEAIREIAAVTKTPPIFIPGAHEPTVEDLTADLRSLDHDLATMRMRPVRFPLSETTLRQRREAIRKERAYRAKLEEWYGAFVPRFAYGSPPPRPVSFVDALAEREAPRLAQFEAAQEAFASPFRQLMTAAMKEGETVAKKKPIADGTTIRTQKTEDLRLDWQDPTPLTQAEHDDTWEYYARQRGVIGEFLAAAPTVPIGEVRTTSSTGGEKGVKPARFDLIPVMPLTRLAELYGAGAAKYESNQWRKGFELSKSYAALQRHVTAFWNGEDNDPETGTPHLAAVAFHAFAMMQILQDFPQHDDRYKKEV